MSAPQTREWRSQSHTIQRGPVRVRLIADEILDEIRRQDCGESDACVQAGKLEGALYFYVGDNEVSRAELIRAAALVVVTIALYDLHEEGKL